MDTNRKNKMETMPMSALIFTMSLPMMISLLVQSLYNIVDSIFVAKLSEQALAAASLAFPVQMLMIAVGVGTAVGLNAILSRTLGKKDFQEASLVAMTGVFLSIASAALFSLAGFLFAGPISAAFTDDPVIAGLCRDYLWICMVFCLGNMMCMTFQRLLQASGNTFLSMIVLICGAITNIVLDPIMIFGWLGCPALGIRGAAYATVIGQWVSMFAGLCLNIRKNPEIKLTLKGFSLRMERIAEIYKVGFPTIIMQALTSVMLTAFNTILLPFSTTAVAFFGVYYKLQNFLFMPMNGLGQALIPIVGYNYGAKRRERILQSARIVYPTASVIALAGTFVFSLLGRQLLELFSAGTDMIVLGVPALRIISVSFVLTSVTVITGYFAAGLGDGVTNMVGAFLRQFFPLIPCTWLLASFGDISVVWYAIWVSEITGSLYSALRFKRLLQNKLSF